MLKRKIEDLDGRDFSIRNCVKDLRLRRVFSSGSDPKDIGSGFDDAGLGDIGSCETGKDPIGDLEVGQKMNNADLVEFLDKGLICNDVTNKIANNPKGILKRPNGLGNEMENPIRTTTPESIINVDFNFTAEKRDQINSSQNGKTRPRILPSRLVKVPGSFSYRRLLPFLMEIDNKEEKAENVSSNSPQSTENPKFDKKPKSEISNSEIQEPNSTPISDPINPPSILDFSQSPNSKIPKSETLNPNSANSIDDSICIPFLSPLSLSSTPQTLTVSELSGRNFSKGEIGISPKRGIIKRDNNRGCKGNCACLDCTSFKIHAEKAFEFSRKQMIEADEIIGGLVKGLSSLRELLELSSGNNHSKKTQSYQNELINVACQRASIAEKIANSRTEQMFMNLNAHCKIPGTKVSFSDCVEQMSIPSCRHDQA